MATKFKARQLPKLNEITAPDGSLSLNSQKITSLSGGSSAGEAVEYSQIGALGFLGSVNNSSLIDNGVVTESKLSTAVQTKLNAWASQSNTTATTDPTVNDDSGDGYSVKSIWLNQSSGEAFMCFDATVGAAVWVKTTLTVDELGSLALLNSVGTSSIENSAVTYAKLQNISAQYKLLGRSSSGAGTVEEIAASSFGFSLLDDADASAARTTLGLVIGTNVQGQNPNLQAMSGVTSEADKLFYFTGSGTGTVATLSSFARTLLDDADAAAARTTLGVVNANSFSVNETPSGTVNGTNDTFTLAHTPVSGTVMVFANGQLLDAGSGNDYTISGSTITFESGAIPASGEKIRATYQY